MCLGRKFSFTFAHILIPNSNHLNIKSFVIPLTFTLDKRCSLRSNKDLTVRVHSANKPAHVADSLVRATAIHATAVGRQRRQTITGIGSGTRINKLLIVVLVIVLAI